jgi:hypothetical protein
VKLLVFFIFVVMPLAGWCQALAGLWRGHLLVSDSTLDYQLVVAEDHTDRGFGQITFLINGVENVGVKKVQLKGKNNRVKLEDFDLVYNNYTTPPRKVKLFADMQLFTKDGIARMEGTFFTRSLDMKQRDNAFARGDIRLQKLPDTVQMSLTRRLDNMNLWTAEGAVASATSAGPTPPRPEATTPKRNGKTPMAQGPGSRRTVIIETIDVVSDTLTMSLYDNSIVDGDTVSIFINNALYVRKIGLTAAPFTYKLRMDSIPSDSAQIVLFAENLGRIPPNTGILILEDGDRRYNIGFSGDLTRNPGIVLRRRPRLTE